MPASKQIKIVPQSSAIAGQDYESTALFDANGAPLTLLALGTTASTAKAGNYVPTSGEVATALKAKTQIAALSTIATADATDLPTAIALANATKAAVNAVINALKA